MASVLIVEDDAVISRGMAEHLALAGFEPTVVDQGETGLARLRYGQPDVCVLDLMLPRIDGWRIIETVRSGRHRHADHRRLGARHRGGSRSRPRARGR